MHGYLLEFTLSLIENLIIIQVITYFFKVKSKKAEIAFVILFSLLAQFINTMNIPVNLLYPAILLALYTCANYAGWIVPKIVISLFVFAVNTFLSYTIISVLEAFGIPALSLLAHDTFLYVCLTVISKFILLSLFLMFRLVLKKVYIKMTTDVNWKIILIEIIVFSIAVMYSFYIFICESIDARMAIFLLSFQAITALISLYFFYKFMKANKDQEEIKHKMQEMLLYNEKSNEESILYNYVQSEYLNLFNLCSRTKDYLAKGNYEEAINILLSIKEPLSVDFENDALSFLINSKSNIMDYHHIEFRAIVGNSLSKLTTEDVIFIIGNLLDSTINELKDKDNASVSLDISEVSSGVKISIASNPFVNKNKMQSTLDKVMPTIEKYNGIAGSFVQNDIHIFKIVLFNHGG